MKTTIDIPDDLLKYLKKKTRSETIRGAVLTAIEWYVHRERQREVIPLLGTLKGFISQEELQAMREEREKRHDARRQQLVGRGVTRPGGSRGSVSRRKSA
jgi:metal-responsive CopG/Arc/MetJ family transcriptional regulator